MKRLISASQSLGRALMLPIAVLPVAGLLLRLGQPDLLDWTAMAAAGDAIFSHLGLLFAIGVAVGLARENHGAAGLAAVVGFLVATQGAEVLLQVPPDVLADAAGAHQDVIVAAWKSKQLAKLSVPMGILSGVISGMLYNRYATLQLPSYLAFFAGRRFVPIAAGCAGLVVAMAFGYGWPVLAAGMDHFSRFVLGSGDVGLFVYGVLNRVLIITGLHHIINNVAWFLLGDFGGVTGDLKRFFAGDPSAGFFMSGFFPIMMFGLPAACLAMYHTALPQKRRETGGLLVSMGLTSFLTGVTEPIEFTFIFLAPALYLVHAILTGTAMVVMHLLGVRLGFSFSAGLFDYVLNFTQAGKPWLLLPVGLAYAAAYYGLFRFFILRFDLKTPGRTLDDPAIVTTLAANGDAASTASARGAAFVAALGGAGNLTEVEACTTRLRLAVQRMDAIDEPALKALGARGVLRLGAQNLQVVVGPIADQVADEMRHAMASNPSSGRRSASPAASAIDAPDQAQVTDPIAAALGGHANIVDTALAGGRVRVVLRDDRGIDETGLLAQGVRALARPAPGVVHLLHAAPEQLLEAARTAM